jgi:hypothetical protein
VTFSPVLDLLQRINDFLVAAALHTVSVVLYGLWKSL